MSQAPKRGTKITKEALRGKARRYLTLREQAKEIKSEQEALSAELKSSAEKYGVQEGRSFVLQLDDIKVSKVGAVSNKIDHAKAATVLASLGLLDRCTTRVINEKELELAFQEGLIGIDDIDSFTTETVSYRIDVR